jgi:hypothetical protein
MGPEPTEHERIAKAFHDEYEARAPQHGYETREASAVPWEQVPEANRNLMIGTVAALLRQGVIWPASVLEERDRQNSGLLDAVERLNERIDRDETEIASLQRIAGNDLLEAEAENAELRSQLTEARAALQEIKSGQLMHRGCIERAKKALVLVPGGLEDRLEEYK